uniref:Uncharacterized protein n=1 Tax=Colobus angolensis palliatus TaxID=336983 RepID=A0A2K5HFD6_COLAP
VNSLQFFANKRRADTGLLLAILKSLSPSPIPSALGIHLGKLCPPGENGMLIRKKVLELIPFFPPFCKRRSLC